MRRHAFFAACLFAGWPVQAERLSLEGEALKHTVNGKTVNLDTPLGIAIPITYHGNGTMSGQAGVLAYILGKEKDRGRWWVEGGKLCQRWFNWLDAKPNCMRVQQDGEKFFWQSDDGKSGTATIAAGLPPGAEAAPRGLGGPAHAPLSPLRSLTADETEEETQPARPSAPPPFVRAGTAPAPVKAAPKHVPTPVKVSRMQPLSANLAAPPVPTQEQVPLPRSETVLLIGENDRWCHAAGAPEAAEQADAPTLVFISRLSYDAGAPAAPTNACLWTEPPLQHLARLGLEMR
jgi:hypothetical protein